MPVRVAVLDDYQEVARGFGDWDSLAPEAEVTVFHGHIGGDDSLAEHLEGYEIVVAMRERTPFTEKRLAKLPALRLIVTTGMANAAIDMDAARERGITVCGTGGLAPPTAELTWALILAAARHVTAEDRAVRQGGWQHTIGPQLSGRTLGVLGLGRLGTRVAEIARAFEMDVVAWSQNLDPDDARGKGVEPVTKEELLERSDVVSIHLRLSERTRGLLGARELGLMKPTAILVNTSRGPIVDEEALLEALKEGTIGGAALDVFDVEPLPRDHPLRSAPRTVLTPHLGYVTTDTYAVFYREAVEDVAAYLRGEPIRVLNG
jgi:phosphoglycerate dehydrogenase-like enzyme